MFEKIQKARLLDILDKVVHITIFISFFVMALETVKEFEEYAHYFRVAEVISLIIFALDYLNRIFTAYRQKEVLKYMSSFIGIIDLLSVLPLFIPFSTLDLRFVKIFRLFSVFRIFKLYRYSEHLRAITKVVGNKKGDLFATLFSILIVLVFCSCLAYFFEKEAQPEQFSNLFQAMYWGVSTLAIGYGDIYPVTLGGKLTATVLAMLGIGLITIPSAILSAGFIEEIQSRKIKKTVFTPPTPKTHVKPGTTLPSHKARRHEAKQTDLSVEEEVEKLV